MHSAGIPCIMSVYACFAQDADAKMITVLLVVAILATTLILRLGFQTKQIEQENMVKVHPGKETKIDITDTVSTSAPSHNNPPVQILEKNSSGNKGQNTFSRVTNGDLGVPSQPAQQPSPPDAVAENRAHVPCLKTEFKVGAWVSMIAAGAIVSVLSGLVGNEKATLTHKHLFQAFTTLNYVSLILGVGLFVITLTRPKIPGFVTIVKVTMWTALGSLTYALDCATCLLLPELFEVILVLVAPFVMVSLIAILSSGSWS